MRTFFHTENIASGKPVSHERKSTLTPTQRDSVPAKSPVSGGDPLASHSPFDPHHRPVVPSEMYRTHLAPHLDHSLAFHRVLDPGNEWSIHLINQTKNTMFCRFSLKAVNASDAKCIFEWNQHYLIAKHHVGFKACSHALEIHFRNCGKSSPLTSRPIQLSYVHRFFSISLISVHVPTATIANRLSQHLPALHYGEHSADHSERLHHLAADAGHTAAWCHEETVTTRINHCHPLPTI